MAKYVGPFTGYIAHFKWSKAASWIPDRSALLAITVMINGFIISLDLIKFSSSVPLNNTPPNSSDIKTESDRNMVEGHRDSEINTRQNAIERRDEGCLWKDDEYIYGSRSSKSHLDPSNDVCIQMKNKPYGMEECLTSSSKSGCSDVGRYPLCDLLNQSTYLSQSRRSDIKFSPNSERLQTPDTLISSQYTAKSSELSRHRSRSRFPQAHTQLSTKSYKMRTSFVRSKASMIYSNTSQEDLTYEEADIDIWNGREYLFRQVDTGTAVISDIAKRYILGVMADYGLNRMPIAYYQYQLKRFPERSDSYSNMTKVRGVRDSVLDVNDIPRSETNKSGYQSYSMPPSPRSRKSDFRIDSQGSPFRRSHWDYRRDTSGIQKRLNASQ
ncbi:hypothetical protein V1511DRAFT_512323 [Dipodascopsis uninucleata]